MKTLFLLICIILLLGESASSIDGDTIDISFLNDSKYLQDNQTFQDYSVSIYRDMDSGQGLLKIIQKDEIVHMEEGFKFNIGLIYEEMPENEYIKIGNDITGDGRPNLVVSHWSGGAHSFFTFYVFQLGEEFKLIEVLQAGDSDGARFYDIDEDGKLEFIFQDWTFDYWNASFAGSAKPQFILEYENGKYVISKDLLKGTLPTKEQNEELMQLIEEDTVRYSDMTSGGWRSGDLVVPPIVWKHILNLICAGHKEEAWAFLDKVWRGDQASKTAFKQELVETMNNCVYYKDLLAQ